MARTGLVDHGESREASGVWKKFVVGGLGGVVDIATTTTVMVSAITPMSMFTSSTAFGVNKVKPMAKTTTVCKRTMGGTARLTVGRMGRSNKVGKCRMRFGFRSSRGSTRGALGTCGTLGS